MSMENFASGEDVETSDKPSGSYPHFYERGHPDLPGEEGDEAYEAIAEAYEHINGDDGELRAAVNRSSEWENIAHFLAQYINAMAESREVGSTAPLLALIEPSSESLAEYLDDNDEVFEDLMERVETTEATSDD